MIKPYSPSDVYKESINKKIANIPDFVIEAVNEILALKYEGDEISFNQDEVIEEIQKRVDIERHEIFHNKYLDFEEVFRKEGWEVSYHKGAYYETFTPYFIFKANSK